MGTAMLINCVAYQEGAKLADISVEAISDHLLLPAMLRLGGAGRSVAGGA
jgi:hypothetical protein